MIWTNLLHPFCLIEQCGEWNDVFQECIFANRVLVLVHYALDFIPYIKIVGFFVDCWHLPESAERRCPINLSLIAYANIVQVASHTIWIRPFDWAQRMSCLQENCDYFAKSNDTIVIDMTQTTLQSLQVLLESWTNSLYNAHSIFFFKPLDLYISVNALIM